jgi:hypothetical protein
MIYSYTQMPLPVLGCGALWPSGWFSLPAVFVDCWQRSLCSGTSKAERWSSGVLKMISAEDRSVEERKYSREPETV